VQYRGQIGTGLALSYDWAMAPLLRVRRATVADEFALFALVSLFPTPTPPSRETFAKALRGKLRDPDSFIAVAELGGKLLGYVSGDAHETFYAGGKVAWVDEILVAESARRQGIGRALMAEFEAWAENGRCRLIGLATRAASTFYEELGFEDSAGYFKRYLRPQDRTKIAL
jgi:GNAT superfamily N-acetyltransferase